MVTVGLPLPHSHHSIELATKKTDGRNLEQENYE
jgi:hypothetical protein